MYTFTFSLSFSLYGLLWGFVGTLIGSLVSAAIILCGDEQFYYDKRFSVRGVIEVIYGLLSYVCVLAWRISLPLTLVMSIASGVIVANFHTDLAAWLIILASGTMTILVWSALACHIYSIELKYCSRNCCSSASQDHGGNT